MSIDPETGEILDVDRFPFAAWLQDLRHGAAHAELTDALVELVAAVQTTGKAGELRLTVKVRPSDQHVTQVIVTDDVEVKAPKPTRPISLFFVDEAHNLTREDPFQQRSRMVTYASRLMELKSP